MKRLIFLLAIAVFALATNAQSADQRLGAAMNSQDYFGLYDTYNSADKDSVSPFLEVFSRGLIGNRFNRPDIYIPAFDELLKTQSQFLDLNSLLSSAMMYSMDLSRTGRNAEAAELLSSVLQAACQSVDSVSLKPYANMAAQYKALAAYTPYRIAFGGEKGHNSL